ncbi:unnamed protein product [Staurois parvus]|uniref:Uncharacterized protein n=1 Tax=Staurois parvus TaxID=386267 RepID=A0ABN9FIL5_9NEOB|nr:unnamed protein product [Staurois parvus]
MDPCPVKYLPEEFILSENILAHIGNVFLQQEVGYRCTRFGGQADSYAEHTKVLCHDLDIECIEPCSFQCGNKLCIMYTGTLWYYFLGCFREDCFCMEHVSTTVSNFLTLGGLGICWFAEGLYLATTATNVQLMIYIIHGDTAI